MYCVHLVLNSLNFLGRSSLFYSDMFSHDRPDLHDKSKYIFRELRPRSILVVVESLTELLLSLLHCIFGSLLPLISSKECGLNILESVI